MTREEAIRRIECCRNFLANNYSDMGEPNFTAFNIAISALEQEPCDAISRQAALDALVDADNWSEEFDSIKALPSVTSSRRKGRWITENNMVKCSECGRFQRDCRYGHTNYCNHCGAEME